MDQATGQRFTVAMLALAVLCVANALLLVLASQVSTIGSPRAQLIAVLAHYSLGAILVSWVCHDSRFARTSYPLIFGLALVLRLVSVFASPLLEDDHYRYLWDGFRTATAFNPYALAPSEFFVDSSLGDTWQEILSGINHPNLPTIYGPVLQYLFAFAYFINPGKLGAIQGLLLVLDLTVVGLLIIERVPSQWVLAYAIHPAITKEVMASAHPDIMVGMFLLMACMAWRRSRPYWTGALLGAAIATKIPAILGCVLLLWTSTTLPTSACESAPSQARAQRFWRAYWPKLIPNGVWALSSGTAMVLVLAVMYLPFWWASGSDFASLLIFGERWKFNPLLFRLLEVLFPAELARPIALLAFICAALGLVLSWRKKNAGYPPLEYLLAALLIFAPVVNPWYWTWGLAIAALCHRPLVSLLACAGAFSYLNSTVLSEAGWIQAPNLAISYQVPWVITLAQITLIFGLFTFYRRLSKRSAKRDVRF